MTIAPETLLRMYPLDALKAQMGGNLKAPLQAKHLKISTPLALIGTKTKVVVSVDKSTAPAELWGAVDEFEFEYERIDLDQFTDGLNKTISTALPVAAHYLLGSMLDKFKIPVVSGDVENTEFPTLGQVSLYAGVNSYRWVGNVQVMLSQVLYRITPLILNNVFTPAFTPDYTSVDFKRNITQLLNIANQAGLPITITTDMFTLSSPVVVGANLEGKNTSIALSFNSSPYVGVVEVIYARRSFPKTYRTPLVISGGEVVDTNVLYGELSTQLGCVITQADLLSTPMDTLSVGQSTLIPVMFDPSSLVYVGEVWINYTRTF